MNREISLEHWRLSFERYFKDGSTCGYCRDAIDHTSGHPCDACMVDNKICSLYGPPTYYEKMHRTITPRTRLKYKNLIRTYIIEEGRRLGYSTPDDENFVRRQ